MTFNVDFHTYGWPTWEQGRLQLPGISYQGERSLKKLVDRCSAVGLDAIGFVNFGDRRFEQLFETAKNLPAAYRFNTVRVQGEPILLAVQPQDEKPVYILRGQQVLTAEGHLLVLGAPKQLADSSLERTVTVEETITEARNLGALVIAPAPFFLQGKNVQGTVPGRAEYTAPLPTEELTSTFDRFHSFYDAVETFSASPWPRSLFDLFRLKQQNQDAIAFARHYDLPAIAVSEAHALSHLGYAYASFPEPISDYEHFLPALREKLRSKEFICKQTTVPLIGLSRCLAADVWNHTRLQLTKRFPKLDLLHIRRE